MEVELFSWYELAFMNSAFSGPPGPIIPFALTPDQGALAVAPGLQTIQVAYNFHRLVPGDLGDFSDRWGTWFEKALPRRLAYADERAGEAGPQELARSHAPLTLLL